MLKNWIQDTCSFPTPGYTVVHTPFCRRKRYRCIHGPFRTAWNWSPHSPWVQGQLYHYSRPPGQRLRVLHNNCPIRSILWSLVYVMEELSWKVSGHRKMQRSGSWSEHSKRAVSEENLTVFRGSRIFCTASGSGHVRNVRSDRTSHTHSWTVNYVTDKRRRGPAWLVSSPLFHFQCGWRRSLVFKVR